MTERNRTNDSRNRTESPRSAHCHFRPLSGPCRRRRCTAPFRNRPSPPPRRSVGNPHSFVDADADARTGGRGSERRRPRDGRTGTAGDIIELRTRAPRLRPSSRPRPLAPFTLLSAAARVSHALPSCVVVRGPPPAAVRPSVGPSSGWKEGREVMYGEFARFSNGGLAQRPTEGTVSARRDADAAARSSNAFRFLYCEKLTGKERFLWPPPKLTRLSSDGGRGRRAIRSLCGARETRSKVGRGVRPAA